MLVFQADQEQEQTFNRLIQTMGEQIAWEGRFIVKDDELILEGAVRSLIFQFETKKVLTNLLDIPVREEQVADISRHAKIRDLINMVLYAFGKWGTLKGLRVEQDYPQLNQLFSKILSIYYIEPSLRKENFRFYKVGVRITYEEVLQTALEFERKLEDDPRAESQGLWHRLIWKKRERNFQKTETTLAQRVEDRIGNNFYLVGYLCPKCSGKLHMAVYPDGKEMRIDTEEKGVYLARAYTCSDCNCFYTPRPDRLISEGLIYEMDFGDDQKAYEDYLELLGYHGEREANFKYNEYEAVRRQRILREKQGKEETRGGRRDLPDFLYSPKDALRQMEEFSRKFASLPDDVFRRFAHRVEEGFYPDEAVAKHEKEILEQTRERNKRQELGQSDTDASGRSNTAQNHLSDAAGAAGNQDDQHGQDKPDRNKIAGNANAASFHAAAAVPPESGALKKQKPEKNADSASEQHIQEFQPGKPDEEKIKPRLKESGIRQEKNAPARAEGAADQGTGSEILSRHTGNEKTAPETKENEHMSVPRQEAPASEQYEKYKKRVGMLHRLSDRQKQELVRQIQKDDALADFEKKELTGYMAQAEFQKKAAAVLKKAESSVNKSYAALQKVIHEVEQEDLEEELKRPFLEKLRRLRIQRGEQEVQKLVEQAQQKRLDREEYQAFEQKIKTYEDVEITPYEETLNQMREEAEKQEIAGLVRRSRKVSRKDYVTLMHRLEDKKFADDTVAPYMEKIKEKVQELDEKRLDGLLDGAAEMDFNAAAAVYEQIEGENFLPELKTDALEMLAKRLEKIRTDECELLVQKLQEELQGKVKENARHHFYPARKVMLKTAEPAETGIIDAALSAYASGRSRFEYPVIVVDTSRNCNGREGMVLTPENLYYSTRMSAYEIPVSSIRSIEAFTGLLNRKILLEETNGSEHKLPYAVKSSEMEDWAAVLDDFVHYLQEKPASRKLAYLAKETHDTICCYRCGYVYSGRDICPECGYKKNR